MSRTKPTNHPLAEATAAIDSARQRLAEIRAERARLDLREGEIVSALATVPASDIVNLTRERSNNKDAYRALLAAEEQARIAVRDAEIVYGDLRLPEARAERDAKVREIGLLVRDALMPLRPRAEEITRLEAEIGTLRLPPGMTAPHNAQLATVEGVLSEAAQLTLYSTANLIGARVIKAFRFNEPPHDLTRDEHLPGRVVFVSAGTVELLRREGLVELAPDEAQPASA